MTATGPRPTVTTPPAAELDDLAAWLRRLLDARLRALLGGAEGATRPLYAMMAYHLGYADERLRPCAPRTGKRLRSLLCFLSCAAAGGEPADALPGALAVELVHDFSLVHDDVQDASPLRRHRPAVWAVWGVPHAINVGDGLFAMALRALVEEGQARAVAHDRLARASLVLVRATQRLCEGQFLDLGLGPERSLSLDDYLAMIERKTGALFACAAELGGLLAGAPDPVAARLRDLGRALGTAFQMHDDLLGVWGDRSTGKPAEDLRLAKLGLPVALAWTRAGPHDRARLEATFGAGQPLSDRDLAWTRALLSRLRVRAEATRLARQQLALARDCLDALPAVPGVARLRELVATLEPAAPAGDPSPAGASGGVG